MLLCQSLNLDQKELFHPEELKFWNTLTFDTNSWGKCRPKEEERNTVDAGHTFGEGPARNKEFVLEPNMAKFKVMFPCVKGSIALGVMELCCLILTLKLAQLKIHFTWKKPKSPGVTKTQVPWRHHYVHLNNIYLFCVRKTFWLFCMHHLWTESSGLSSLLRWWWSYASTPAKPRNSAAPRVLSRDRTLVPIHLMRTRWVLVTVATW